MSFTMLAPVISSLDELYCTSNQAKKHPSIYGGSDLVWNILNDSTD